MSLPLSAQPNFGSAWSCITDVTMPAVMVTGFRVVGEAVARRWGTPRGQLVDDPNYGTDLTDYVSDDTDAATLARAAQGAAAEAKKDQRVLSCSCTVTFANGVMRVTGLIGTAAGPFTLVVDVSQVTVILLQPAAQ